MGNKYLNYVLRFQSNLRAGFKNLKTTGISQPLLNAIDPGVNIGVSSIRTGNRMPFSAAEKQHASALSVL